MSDLHAGQHTVDSLREWLTNCVASHLERPADTIDTSVRLSDYGLDSLYVLSVAGELEDHLDISLDPTLLWDNPTIDALSEALAKELAQYA
ncbi:acyl carrier protein [Streptomyces sp. 110]|uniref:Acyl carrier protein n=1 Tax=Streptomyces endocoffeicus TaxID=2898945 RepID=A0ABS1PGC3_9ACTN|nr:acyl carrier protein [Streptomyces endocoffeicus]MBL1111436.1 acyl carrier protein [Streptomyces endocoffeicus]